MIRRDLVSNIGPAMTQAPAARTASANGTTVDLSGFGSATAVLTKGTITDGTHTPVFQESDDDATWTDVDAADLNGAFAAITSASTATTQKVGYKGNKRYVRVKLTAAGTTTGGLISVSIIRGDAAQRPVA